MRPLRWEGEDADGVHSSGNFSVTGLVKYLYGLAQAAPPAGAATQLVVTLQGESLAALAGTGTGRSAFDWSSLHRLMERIPAGRWTSYGDVATVVGTAAQPLGGHVTTCERCENAWRLLDANGRPSPGFRWGDGRTGSPINVLRDEGVRFNDDVADPAQRLSVDELRTLLTAAD